jgi:hypothetical protein
MHEGTRESAAERGEVNVPGRCDVCGAIGPTIVAATAAPPNQLCPRCAIEYQDAVAADAADDEP